MNEVILLFLALAITISLLHLLTSAIIMTKKVAENFNKKKKNKLNYPPITILKPLKGIDDGLEDNLKSFFKIDYPNYEIIFGLDSYSDPAFNVVKKLQKEYNSVNSRLIVNNFAIGLNPKVNNLNNIYPFAEGEFILINDSNTRVQKDFLKNLRTFKSSFFFFFEKSKNSFFCVWSF